VGERDIVFTENRPNRPWDPTRRLFHAYRGSSPGVKHPGREADH